MELSKEVRELYRNAREEICCDECLSKDSNICPCDEVVRLRRLVDDVVKAERERCVNVIKNHVCSSCFSRDINCEKINCMAREIIKSIEGGNENERQIES